MKEVLIFKNIKTQLRTSVEHDMVDRRLIDAIIDAVGMKSKIFKKTFHFIIKSFIGNYYLFIYLLFDLWAYY